MTIENPAAFPCKTRKNTSSDPFATPREIAHPGMTLRDYFAGQAISGYLAGVIIDTTDGGPVLEEPEVIARRCYVWADAMLAARAIAEGTKHD
jgi:hypothetical protein